jgi:tetratricopeptide (TPR) repeat protein
MLKRTIFLSAFAVFLFSTSHAADPFYLNLLNEGKQQLASGKLDEALESFKLAEFGLVDERDQVPELYYHYSLTQFKKGQMGETQALLDKMKLALGVADLDKIAIPKEISGEVAVMLRSLDYFKQPGAKPGMLPFYNLFYETWELLKVKKLPEAETRLKAMDKMSGDKPRLLFLEGFLAFLKNDYKRCLGRLEKISGPLPEEISEDASFLLTFSYLKQGNMKEGEKWAQKIKNPEHIHQIMELMDEIKGSRADKKK